MRWACTVLAAVALLGGGCVGRCGQDRFLRIDGLICTSTELERPLSWEKNEDAAWVQRRLRCLGADSARFLAAVEGEDPFRPEVYSGVWIAGSSEGGLLIATREYQADRLLHWLQGERRELGAIPVLENLSLPLSGTDVELLEHSLRRLSVQRCTDTVRFLPEEQDTYHVRVRLGTRESEFSVFAPALWDYERAANTSIRWLVEYDRLSRREADVVAAVLDFADQRLMDYLKLAGC